MDHPRIVAGDPRRSNWNTCDRYRPWAAVRLADHAVRQRTLAQGRPTRMAGFRQGDRKRQEPQSTQSSRRLGRTSKADLGCDRV